jgi:hypothetical protein
VKPSGCDRAIPIAALRSLRSPTTRSIALSRRPRLVPEGEDPLFEVRANRAGENYALEVAAFADQVVGIVAMGDARHVLIDDGPLIQPRSGVVSIREDVLAGRP